MIPVICIVAFLASLLTFYSGFGLGTLLSAFLFLFFDVPSALFITAIVHLLNNLFKISLVAKNVDWSTVKYFGVPSISGALFGAFLLKYTAGISPLYKYTFYNKNCEVTYIKMSMAIVMLFFTFFEAFPFFKKIKFESIGLTFGGLISGFFGGLSGHQGALRSVFLLRANLSKQHFIGTGVMIACLVDFTRLPMYYTGFNAGLIEDNLTLIITATLAAFIGAFVGAKYIEKITIDIIQKVVSILIIFIAVLLFAGLI